MEQLQQFFDYSFISSHLNILLLLGIALFGGTIGGRLFQRIKFPQVVGYIIIGILVGQTGLNIVDKNLIDTFLPFNDFALGLIGFMVGGELKVAIFRKYGKQFTIILFLEALTASLFVFIIVFGLCMLVLKQWTYSLAYALVFGSIASATAAAGTTDVIWEYKAKGPLTTTILGIVALDDILALFLFAVSSSFVKKLIGVSGTSKSWLDILLPMYEIVGAVVIGMFSGAILSWLLNKFDDEDRIFTFSIGAMFLVLGAAIAVKVDMIMAAMVMGVVITNHTPEKSKKVFKILERISTPVYVLFFVLVGAKLNITGMTSLVLYFVLAFLVGRSTGKMLGSWLGAKISRVSPVIARCLPLCLFSQSGVAIGLAILSGQRFSGSVGDNVVAVITATTFIVQLVGPIFLKIGLRRSGETGVNITEDDVINTSKVRDFLANSDCVKIREDMPVQQVIQVFSEGDNLYYPAVDKDDRLVGIISVDNIKNTLMYSLELVDVLVAHDLMEHCPYTASLGQSMRSVFDMIAEKNLEYVPVIDNDKVVGILETRLVRKAIARKIETVQSSVGEMCQE
ncbi:MAG: cation:proton antiporter [Spirochaetales bacterium]|nr:cation:proton antiporter [Spirochaetales bacterium]